MHMYAPWITEVFEKRHLVAERIKLFSVRYRANIGIFVLLVTPGRFKIRHRQGPSLTVLLMRTPRMTQCVEVRGYFASRHLRPVTDDQLQALDDVVMWSWVATMIAPWIVEALNETTPLSFVQLPQLNYWLLEVSDVGRSPMARRGGSIGRTDVVS